MNTNLSLCPSRALLEKFPGIDTRVTTCPHCAKRLPKFTEAIRLHEYHSGVIFNDVDNLKTEAII